MLSRSVVRFGRDLFLRVEVVDAALARIDELNCKLLAYCTPTAELARTHARDIERRLAAGERVGVLAGVPISIKDLIFTRGVLTTGGAVAYADFVPDEDDIVVERLGAATPSCSAKPMSRNSDTA